MGNYERNVGSKVRGPLDAYSLLEVATIQDYIAWLSGFISNGGRTTHQYDYEFQRGNFYIAKSHIAIPRLYGAEALHIIIPEGVEVIYRDSIEYLINSESPSRLQEGNPSLRGNIENLAGSQKMQVIVPSESHPDIGHNQLYFMRKFKQLGDWVPTYSDFKDPTLLEGIVLGLAHSPAKK